MDAQYRHALLTGSPQLRVLALGAIVIQAIADRLEHAMRFVQERAPACACGQGKALSCGDCYDRLEFPHGADGRRHLYGEIDY